MVIREKQVRLWLNRLSAPPVTRIAPAGGNFWTFDPGYAPRNATGERRNGLFFTIWGRCKLTKMVDVTIRIQEIVRFNETHEMQSNSSKTGFPTVLP